MSKYRGKSLALLLIGLAGLLVSFLTGAQDRIPFLQSLCSAACRETAEIVVVLTPLWMWGVTFYLAVLAIASWREELLPWLVGCGVGLEGALIWAMILMGAPCVFCLANAAIIFLLLAVSFRRALAWQEATLALLFLLVFSYWIPFENPSLGKSQASPGAPQDGIAATVGKETIPEQKLDVLLGGRLLDARREIFRMKKDKLDQLVVDSLLEQEARTQGKDFDKYIEEAVPLSKFSVSDEEVTAYLDANQGRMGEWRGSMEGLRERVRAYLQGQKRLQAINEHAKTLEAKHGVRIFLSAPQPPNVKVDVAGAPALGPPDAPVTIIEFSDYECPACRSTHETIKRVRAAYGDKIRWYFKDYPLKRHKEAFKAAEAAHCADLQGMFWPYQERLFTADKLAVDSLVQIAGEMGMARDKLEQCVKESRFKQTVEKHHRDGVEAGIDRTPAFIINGRVFVGGPAFETFKGVIDEELKKSARKN